MSTPFDTRPLTPKLGAEIRGLRLADGVDDATFAAIYQAFLRYEVLLFEPQELPPAAHVAFGRRFGEVQVHVMNQYHSDGFPELYRLSNLDDQGQPSGKHPDKGTMSWHTDGSWSRVTGQATIIYGEKVPAVGGQTHFADMYGAYERLDDAWKGRLEGLRAVHNLDFSRNRRHAEDPMTEEQKKAKPPVDHPIVRTHPETGRRTLFVNRVFTSHIVGLDADDSAALIDRLCRQADYPEYQCRFHWTPDAVAFWDNRAVQHYAASDYWPDVRIMERASVIGDRPC